MGLRLGISTETVRSIELGRLKISDRTQIELSKLQGDDLVSVIEARVEAYRAPLYAAEGKRAPEAHSLQAQIETLKSALHEDQTGLALALTEIWRTAISYSWVAAGRGLYEWDDPKYRKEMGRMIADIIARAENGLTQSGSRAHKHCCGRK